MSSSMSRLHTSALLDDGHGKIVSESQLAEGGFHRVFLLFAEEGCEAIAKIPYHTAVTRYYATASEAATLTFHRSQGIPVSEV